MEIKMHNKIMGIIFTIIFLIGIVNAAEFDLKINAQINDFDADFYAQTDTGSNNDFDYMDSELRSYPSGNYSFLYSVITGHNLIIDSWAVADNPRTLNIIYETSPTNVVGTLTFSWNSPGTSYTATLYDYGTDSGRTTLVNSVAMNSVFSYSVSHSSASGKRYLQLKVEPPTAGCPLGTTLCSDGICKTSCGSDGPGTCTPSCPSPSSVDCGSSISDGCDGTCSGTGTKCTYGTCNSNTGNCDCTPVCKFPSEVACGVAIGNNGCGETCDDPVFGTKCTVGECNSVFNRCISCTKTCSSEQLQCGQHDFCGTGVTTTCGPCSLGKTCNAAFQCVDQCTDTCSSLGYECGTQSICGIERVCGSCNSDEVCNSGICGEGEKLKDDEIPLDIPRIGGYDCVANVFCSDFGECISNYNVYNLISGDQVSGIHERTCIDKNNCVPTFVLKESCTLKQEIYSVNKVWCGNNYTEVRDASGKVLARLRVLANGKVVTLDFNLESEGYCPSCYDGIRNGDETNVDCGGSCISCDYVREKLVWYKDPQFLLFSSLLLFLIFLIAFSGVAIQTYKYYKDRILLHIWMRRYHSWKRKGYDAGVLHKDYSAIKRHYDELKRRLN